MNPDENRKRWWQRGSWYYDDRAEVVPGDRFVSFADARRALGARTLFAVTQRVAARMLDPARRETRDGAIGVTRESLERELAWRDRAGRWARIRRAFWLWI